MRARLAALLAPSLIAAASAQAWEWDIPAWLPPPADNPMTADKVELGRRLFYDARIALDGTVAWPGAALQSRSARSAGRQPAGLSSNPF